MPEFTEKQIKAAIKEGGKKGQDIAGLADMGVKFFHLSLENCEGELELVQHAMNGANREVDEGAEDRKGGAGEVGKMFLSANDKQVAIIAHVPECLKDKLNLREWFERVTGAMTDAEVKEEDEHFIKAIVKANIALEKFPLKMRDAGINTGFDLLREKSLVPEDESSDDDDVNYAEAAGVEW